jgi:hypothetical protein
MKHILFVLSVCIALQGSAQVIHDHSATDASFLAFKTQLLDCVVQQDTQRLKGFLADYVFESKDICGYPGCPPDQFMLYYFTDHPEETWELMEQVIRLGFTTYQDADTAFIVPHAPTVFKAPSYLATVDTETQLVVLGTGIRIRQQPGLSATVIRTASNEVFGCNCTIDTMTEQTHSTKDGIDWIEISLPEGGTGYVAMRYTSYPTAKNLTIARVKGEWKIIEWFHAPGC